MNALRQAGADRFFVKAWAGQRQAALLGCRGQIAPETIVYGSFRACCLSSGMTAGGWGAACPLLAGGKWTSGHRQKLF